MSNGYPSYRTCRACAHPFVASFPGDRCGCIQKPVKTKRPKFDYGEPNIRSFSEEESAHIQATMRKILGLT